MYITYNLQLLPYDKGSNSVIQSDLLKTFECDVMIGHPVMPAHDVTTQLRATTAIRHDDDEMLEIFTKYDQPCLPGAVVGGCVCAWVVGGCVGAWVVGACVITPPIWRNKKFKHLYIALNIDILK